MTQTMKEMVETACRAAYDNWDDVDREFPEACVKHRDRLRAGLLAVLDKHVGPMLADAFANGQAFEVDQRQPNAYMPRITPKMYAAAKVAAIRAALEE